MPNSTERKARIHYARVDEFWHKEQKYAYLEEKQHVGNVEWHELQPDAKGNWLTVGMQDEFDAFLPIGSKKAKAAARDDATTIFKNYGRGVATTRDAWAYNFGRGELEENIRRTIQTYNEHVYKWAQQKPERSDVDSFVSNDDTRISWSEGLKNSLARGLTIEYQEDHIRHSLYRPFTTSFLYFDGILNERRYQFPAILPVAKLEEENLAICLSGIGSNKPFHCLLVNLIPILRPPRKNPVLSLLHLQRRRHEPPREHY